MTDIQGSQPASVKDAGITAVVVLPLPPAALTGYPWASGSEPAAGPAPGALLGRRQAQAPHAHAARW